MLLVIVLLHDPFSNFVIVIVEFPAVVKPVAVNEPLPADDTVMVAVKPVAAGELRLYVTVYVPVGNSAAEDVTLTVDEPVQELVASVVERE